MATTAKKKVHPVRFTYQEYEWLKEQAEGRGVSVGEVVRDLIKESMKQVNSKAIFVED